MTVLYAAPGGPLLLRAFAVADGTLPGGVAHKTGLVHERLARGRPRLGGKAVAAHMPSLVAACPPC
jgi:hypothetical protein